MITIYAVAAAASLGLLWLAQTVRVVKQFLSLIHI